MLVGLLPIAAFTHVMASTVHMQTILFSLFGLVAAVSRLAAARPED
jgi:hypothetical protein